MAASWTTGFLGIVFARAGSLTYTRLGFFVSSALHPPSPFRGGATPTLVITAARSPRGWPRFHVSRTCQLGVTTRRDLCFIPLLPRLVSPIFTDNGVLIWTKRFIERFSSSKGKKINLPFFFFKPFGLFVSKSFLRRFFCKKNLVYKNRNSVKFEKDWSSRSVTPT